MKILFIINTEFHLFVSLQLYYTIHRNNDVKFVIIKNSRRFKSTYDLPVENIIIENLFELKQKVDYKSIVEKIDEKFDMVYLFQDADYINNIMISFLKEKYNSKMILVQDGFCAYEQGYTARKMFNKYIKISYYKLFLGVKYLKFVIKWGKHKYIDEYLLTCPDKLYFKTNKIKRELLLESNNDFTNEISKIFKNENILQKIDSNKKYIFYLSQSLSLDYCLKEIEIFKLIKKSISNSNYKFLVKLHPAGVFAETIEFCKNNDIEVIKEPVPAEMIFSKLANSIIITAFSSASLFKVKSNDYLWIYPLITNYKKLKIPVEYIRVVNDCQQLKDFISNKIEEK